MAGVRKCRYIDSGCAAFLVLRRVRTRQVLLCFVPPPSVKVLGFLCAMFAGF